MSRTFTFKKEARETGLRAVGNPNPNTKIKHNGMEVGVIYAPSWRTKDNKWSISLAVKRGDDWKWVNVKKRFDEEKEARSFIVTNALRILSLGLHYFDD